VDTIPAPMPIDIDIAYVARLARLGLNDEDLERYRVQLGLILEHAARVQQLDASSLEPTAHPLGLTNTFRKDQIRPSLDRAEVLSQAPAQQEGYFVVPPALESP
jgi:aspartyl-tRNA(Asn)/glutamyl-tRNA(Gln) amidotransferase subunit C